MRSEPTTRAIWDGLTDEVRAAFGLVHAVVLDVDGVLTDGKVHIASDGTQSVSIHIRDGSGTWLLHKSGIRVGVVTGRDTGILEQHVGALRIDELVTGCRDKDAGLREVLGRWGIAPQHCAYVGDDLLDAGALRIAGLPICVSDAAAQVLPLARYVTHRPGGDGAVREVAELVLEGRGLLDAAIRRTLGEAS